MSRISEMLLQIGDRKLLIPFFTAGYPTMKTTLNLVKAVEDSGADIVELGIPFSDPMADGPAIQYSSQHALKQGTNLKSILQAVYQLREKSNIPIILMGYLNPIHAYGRDRFIKAASRAGVDGLIIPDLPVHEAGQLIEQASSRDVSTVFLVAPTTPRKRIIDIDMASTDFVYAVTVTGVTGTGKRFDNNTFKYFRHLKRSLSKPFVAGFGVSNAETACQFCQLSDGVVIGSALVNCIRQAKTAKQSVTEVSKFLTKIRKAI